MTNDQVITILTSTITELKARREELQALQGNLPGPVFDLPAQLNDVADALAQIERRIANLELRKAARLRAAALGQAVKPLSASRRKAMEDALAKVSSSIAAVGTFKASIKLARDIAAAASNADAASVLT